MQNPKTLLTAEDLLNMPDDGKRYELLDGELVEMAPTNGRHGGIEGRFIQHFNNYLDDIGGGEAMSGVPGVILHRNPDRVRCPDVMLYVQGRVPSAEEQDSFLVTIPDLVVEVISPSDRAGQVHEKVAEWLDAGVRLVLAVYPRSQTIVAHRSRSDNAVYTVDDILDVTPVLPDFAVPVAVFFAQRG